MTLSNAGPLLIDRYYKPFPEPRLADPTSLADDLLSQYQPLILGFPVTIILI
jgi:hypothetical protein